MYEHLEPLESPPDHCEQVVSTCVQSVYVSFVIFSLAPATRSGNNGEGGEVTWCGGSGQAERS